MTKKPDLLLEKITTISRPVSLPEYYHACIGKSSYTIENSREIIFIIEGDGKLSEQVWQAALDKVTSENPGTRFSMQGKRHKSRWQSDGKATQLRMIKNCLWDGRSEQGAEFLYDLSLSLEGPASELIIAESDNRTLVIMRTLHTIMDGRGVMHFFNELFCALRNEPLTGSNANFSDTELMRAVNVKKSTSRYIKTTALSGLPRGDSTSDSWRRITIVDSGSNLTGRIAMAMAEFHRQHSELPTLIAIPIDLRRHLPGISSTCNFTNMLLVEMHKEDDAKSFRQKLQFMLEQNMDAFYVSWLDLLKHLPLSWFDCLASRTRWNYKKKKALETAVISNIGRYNAATFSCDGFQAKQIFGLPLQGSAYSIVFSTDGITDITVGMPGTLASDNRLNNFVQFLAQSLKTSDPKQ